MFIIKIVVNCRFFLKVFVVVGGGMFLGFGWLLFCVCEFEIGLEILEFWIDINVFLKIGDNGVVIIMLFNLEIG